MFKNLIQIISLSLLLGSCAFTKTYSKSESPIVITEECLASTIIANEQYKVVENKKDNISFVFEGLKLNAVYAEKKLIVSSKGEVFFGYSSSAEAEIFASKLTKTTDQVWQHIVKACKQ
ncbi:hypothetical protein QN395_13825 [Undibacterium sp. RTI2.2]|uniref:hypothetical protein n=1 Tax=unclassified Undibacterium TaxID=2630295 RepID=UPI002AB5B5CE|nr:MULTISPECIES: hypothetical protein [unclassified Undibacterium]MDY7537243.1 hypothetical protein [Undibacterium sp. 5I1]MEB0117574.1 hypothetical protein [Undibacterium sp. RTI2.2]MEB0230344.1 hypothetical protein [Undibacterium sp. 10I3]MEB0258146.1 hypothetical protein [Undibacterium sp. 5I1]